MAGKKVFSIVNGLGLNGKGGAVLKRSSNIEGMERIKFSDGL